VGRIFWFVSYPTSVRVIEFRQDGTVQIPLAWTAANPNLRFVDFDTGLFGTTTPALGVAVGGSEVAKFATTAGHNLQGLAWTTFAPVLATTNVQPVLGTTGQFQEGRWCQIGSTVFVQGLWRWGSTGETIGSGNYLFTIGGISGGPPNISADITQTGNTGLILGNVTLLDNSAGTSYSLVGTRRSTTQINIIQQGSPDALVTQAAPIALAENDWFYFSIWYEAA
jgi:hypothetical protein